MTVTVQTIEAAFDAKCIVKRCKKGKCSLKLDGVPEPHVVVDFDKPGSPLGEQETRCDYLFVSAGMPGLVVPMELSAGNKRPTKHIDQLQAGADIACKTLPKTEMLFLPVFVGRVKPNERREIRKKRIRIRGKNVVLEAIACGGALKDALKKAR